MKYTPFIQDGNLRNFHISECEDVTYSELMKRDYFESASQSEKFYICRAKCGLALNLMRKYNCEFWFDTEKQEMKSIKASLRKGTRVIKKLRVNKSVNKFVT